jgi:hypothetical protein
MSKHDQAIDAFRQGQLQQAVRLLEELLKQQENSELWNDWATVQLASGNVSQAEAGLLCALELDSNNQAAKADLGILLLGRGENSRAIALIQECLPLLAPQQQEVLRIALRSATAPAEPGLCVLVVHDRVPERKPGEPEAHLLQIVRAFQELGHSVTLISRAPGDSERLSKELGIKIYAGDVERLPCLGIQTSDTGWRLEQILARGSFDFAVLTQNFSNGLSVPEHYLHAIRRLSSQTKIAILADELHGVSAAARAQLSGEFRHVELAEDWSQREREAFHKADLVWVSNRHDAENLQAQDISVAIIPYAWRSVRISACRPF